MATELDDDYDGDPIQTGGGNTSHASVASKFDRDAAMAYAATYWDKTCSDGFVAVSYEKSPFREVQPALAFANPGQAGAESSVGTDGVIIPPHDLDDCTHFASCCIGNPWDAAKLRPMLQTDSNLPRSKAPVVKAGGLDIHPDWLGAGATWLYGKVGAPQLVEHLISRGFAAPVAPKKMMTGAEAADWFLNVNNADRYLMRGDIIALAVNFSYTHVLVYAGNQTIYCHTWCRSLAYWRINTSASASYTLLHIKD
jgi:hypothetical protein